MRTQKLAEWHEEAISLFGDRWSLWKFKCVRCGHVQCGQDFKAAGLQEDQIAKVVHFSCIGRWVKGVGCDWTLGGLLTIHKLEVINGEGTAIPSFEFADPAGN